MSLVTDYNEELLLRLEGFKQIKKEYLKNSSTEKKVVLFKNFVIEQKSNRTLSFSFENRVNLVLGKTGSGKTFTIKLLKWLLLNKKSKIQNRAFTDKINKLCLEFLINNVPYKLEWNTSISKNERMFGKMNEPNQIRTLKFEQFITEINKILGWPREIMRLLKGETTSFSEIQELFFVDENYSLTHSLLKRLDLSIDYLDNCRLRWLQKRVELTVLNKYQLSLLESLNIEQSLLNNIQKRNQAHSELLKYISNLIELVNMAYKKRLEKKFCELVDSIYAKENKNFFDFLKNSSSSKHTKLPNVRLDMLSRSQRFIIGCMLLVLLKVSLKINVPLIIDSLHTLDEHHTKKLFKVFCDFPVRQAIIFSQTSKNLRDSDINVVQLPEFQHPHFDVQVKDFIFAFLRNSGFEIYPEESLVLGSQTIVFDFIAKKEDKIIIIEEKKRKHNLEKLYYPAKFYLRHTDAKIVIIIFTESNSFTIFVTENAKQDSYRILEFDLKNEKEISKTIGKVLSDYLEGT